MLCLDVLYGKWQWHETLVFVYLFANIANETLFSIFRFLEFAFRAAVLYFVLVDEFFFWIDPVSGTVIDTFQGLTNIFLKESYASSPAGDWVCLKIRESFNFFEVLCLLLSLNRNIFTKNVIELLLRYFLTISYMLWTTSRAEHSFILKFLSAVKAISMNPPQVQ